MDDQLQELGERYEAARLAMEDAQRQLHALVREARATGMTLRRIGELSGLSYGRIFQLTKGEDGGTHH